MQQRTRRIAGALVGALLVASSCTNGGSDDAEPDPSTTRPVTATGAGGGVFQISLSAGQAGEVSPLQVVDGDGLDATDTAAVLDRLPEWSITDQSSDFNRPTTSLSPPIAGATINTAFPPPVDVPPPVGDNDAPLEVVRFQPEGDVALAPFLSVTFNQPMVPLTPLELLDQADVPITIEPEVPGRWRWIGTRTLRFEVEPGLTDRLPMATDYIATVPAGTTAANGRTLSGDVSWTFSTPPAVPNTVVPLSDSLPLSPVFFVGFDQLVDPATVLASTTLTANGDSVAIRLATAAEVADDETIASQVAIALESRWFAFTPEQPLPVDASIAIAVGPGAPSLEGPRTADSATTFTGRTYPALRVNRSECGYGNGCRPGDAWSIQFSNPLDPDLFDPSLISVSPSLRGKAVDFYGDTINIRGLSNGQTTYAVTLANSITDTFGQALGDGEPIEFEVGSALPSLQGFDRQFMTLDPQAASKGVSITTTNHESVNLTVWKVGPSDVNAFQRYLENQWSDTQPAEPEWPVLVDEVVELDTVADSITESLLDLSTPLEESSQLVVRVAPTESYSNESEEYWQNQPTIAWVQSTNLGIDAVVTNDTMLVWTTDLSTGEPRPNVEVSLLGSSQTITTDDAGLATIKPMPGAVRGLSAVANGRPAMLVAAWSPGWQPMGTSDQARWYTFDDRGIYKPGETMRLKGWIRKLAGADDPQLALIGDGASVDYQVYDPQGVELGTGKVDVNALGGFELSIDLPEGTNLGQAWVYLNLTGAAGVSDQGTQHTFSVQEYRTPEFEVNARHESSAPYFLGEDATLAVDAAYYAGGPLPDAEVGWRVTNRTTQYTPPNRQDYTFGIWTPWWYGFTTDDSDYQGDCFDCGPGIGGEAEVKEFAGRTDADGSHYLQMAFSGPEVDQPTTVSAQATVTDVNRQQWSSQTEVLVHPSALYVGLRSDRAFVEAGTPLRIQSIVTDIDGSAVPGSTLSIEAARIESNYANGRWIEELVDVQVCEVTSTDDETDDATECEFSTDIGGTYKVTGTVTDDSGRTNRSELTRWVSGGAGRPSRNVAQEAVTIVPDSETYAPGDTAEILVQAPFSPATGHLIVQRGGVQSAEIFDAPDGSAILTIPIGDRDIPNLSLMIEMVGSAERTADDGTPLPDAPRRPAFATGTIDLSIPPVARTLGVVATPGAVQLEPGDDTSVTVEVTNPDGSPAAGAEVALVVVDEAVLSLTGYQLPDPLSVFYTPIYSNTYAEYIRSTIVLNRADRLNGGDEGAVEEGAATETTEASATFSAADSSISGEDSAMAESDASMPASQDTSARSAGGAQAPSIDVRADFDAVAIYRPSELTNADGTVSVEVSLPDNLTRYRVMAVAVDGADRFGSGESTITARLPLMVRPSAPRFLNFGDRFELPIVVQNQTDSAMDVDVVVETANLELTDGNGRRITVPANDRVEVRFPAAAVNAGTAQFRVAAISGEVTDGVDHGDSATISLPVYTPATAEAFATYGAIDSAGGTTAIAQPLVTPTGIYPQFGGLEIDTSSTAMQALTDAVLYLDDYPYENADGRATRIIAIVALREVLAEFDAAGLPDPNALEASMRRDLDALTQLQNDDGGFASWRRGDVSEPFTSLAAMQAMVSASNAGYSVSQQTIDQGLWYLTDIESRVPQWYHQEVRDTLSAYALHVRNLAGDRDSTKAQALYDRAGDSLGLDALAWMWPVIDDPTTGNGTPTGNAIERAFLNRATETAGAATFTTDYGEQAYLLAYSDRRTDGIILDALITQRPESDLIPKVVQGLLGNQIKGRWNNAYENSFILLAMQRYFATFESVTPDFVARAWLGDQYAVEHVYDGRTTDRGATLVPMADLIGAGDTSLTLANDGSGRLYYRLGLRYAPDDLQLDSRDEGFVVDRTYESVDGSDDVTLGADGIWRVKAGATIRVRVTMVADATRTNMVLIDPLPAGFEPLNSTFANVGSLPPDVENGDPAARGDGWCWCGPWYQHQNLRDDRVEAFAGYLAAGTYEYVYTARATTPGEFVVPPARAEEIYAPEVFGRSASTSVIIE